MEWMYPEGSVSWGRQERQHPSAPHVTAQPLLTITPGKSPRVLAKLVREEVRSLEPAERVSGLSVAAREAVLLRLREGKTAEQ